MERGRRARRAQLDRRGGRQSGGRAVSIDWPGCLPHSFSNHRRSMATLPLAPHQRSGFAARGINRFGPLIRGTSLARQYQAFL